MFREYIVIGIFALCACNCSLASCRVVVDGLGSDTNVDSLIQGPRDSNSTEENSGKPFGVHLNGGIVTLHGPLNIFLLGSKPLKSALLESEGIISKLSTKYQPSVPSGYLTTPGIGSHKLYTRRVIWNKARTLCIAEGGHLAIINSESEEKILLRMMEDENLSTDAWLGMHDLFEEGSWMTVNGEPLEKSGHSRWAKPNQPDNFGNNQHCGTLFKNGSGLDDRSCNAELPYFCEIPFE